MLRCIEDQMNKPDTPVTATASDIIVIDSVGSCRIDVVIVSL